MKNPLDKLILASLLALASACGENATPAKPGKETALPAKSAESASPVSPTKSSGFVAGLQPNQRPAGAPVIREFVPNANWRARSLTGFSEPIPVGLGFLDSQGAWYTPFNQPGMPGYYDLRDWRHGVRDSNRAGQ
ncbi:hypothetical protein [Methylomagnum sp.]